VGITPANLVLLKNGRAKAVRFATLAALCEALECQPGDLLRWEADDGAEVTRQPRTKQRSAARGIEPPAKPGGPLPRTPRLRA
jgi:putative transcriptional regulator